MTWATLKISRTIWSKNIYKVENKDWELDMDQSQVVDIEVVDQLKLDKLEEAYDMDNHKKHGNLEHD